MPLYEYECEHGHRFERIVKFSDPPLDRCPTCGSIVRKLMSSPAIQFKGSGWYITDYARKGTDGKESKDAKDAKPAGESKESATSETKETKDAKETRADKPATTETAAQPKADAGSTASSSKHD